MAQVNLLPWREAQRQQQKKQYLTSLLIFAMAIFALVYLGGEWLEQQIRNQNARNQFLQAEISILDAQIDRIKQIKATKAAIAQRMALIEQLQISKNVTPILFDELARIVPDGVAFEKMSRVGNRIEIVGNSDSNNRLSGFMRALEESDIFTAGMLSSIKADTDTANALSNFKLTFSLSSKVAPVLVKAPSAGEQHEI